MRLAASLVLLAISTSPSFAAQPPTAGCVAWTHAAALALAGRVEDGGVTGGLTMRIDPRDGRYASEQDYTAFSQASGFDGHVGWSKDRSGASHDLNADAARAITATETWLFRRGWCDTGRATFASLPDETQSGAVLRVWRVTPTNGIPVVLRFDATNGLLREAKYRLWGNTLIRHYDDWHDVGRGVLVAFSEKDEDPEDEDTQTIRISSASIGRHTFAATTFARPRRPNDAAILGGSASTTVPYEDDGAARIYVPVFVNGKGPFAFEIDTGGHLIIGDDLAGTLGLKPVGKFANTGAGTAVAHLGVASNLAIRIGDAVLSRQVAKVRPFANDRPGGKPPRAGLLGLELFERFAVQIDREKKTVTLTPLETFSGGNGTALPIRFIEDAPLVTGAYNGSPGDFEIDSGNSGPTIIEGYWAHAHGIDTALAKGIAWGAGSGADAYPEWLSRGGLSLGPVKLPAQIVTYVGQPQRGSESTHLQAGVAGEWALRCFDMTYDFGHGVLWLGDRHNDCSEPPFNHAGLRVAKDGDGLAVATVVPGTPADTAGIKPGDKIVTIGGKDASQLSVRDASQILAGSIGSEVDIRYSPKTGGDMRDVRLRLVDFIP